MKGFSVQGFRASGISCGIKGKGLKDLALIYSERPATVAGLFTTNRVKAAPVLLDMERIRGGAAQAIIVNSGNANACTGRKGLEDAREMAGLVAARAGIDEGLVLVASTGVIGEPLPMERIRSGMLPLFEALSEDGWDDAARAIMTTDTRPKVFFGKKRIGDDDVPLLGIAKGAGMIMPNMATMLAFFVTDAGIDREALQEMLGESVERTFNRITVDGEMSTNDTVLILANGMGRRLEGKDYSSFKELLMEGCETLSRLIVEDGEGATKIVEVEVRGAFNEGDAKRAAFRIANSLLVKTAIYGCDPNWGRIMAALGSVLEDLEEERVRIEIMGLPVVEGGMASPERNEERLREAMGGRRVHILVDLGLGSGEARVLTTDLTPEYVHINAAYRT